MIDTILDPQIWLILVALVHAVVGVILPTEWEDDTNKLVSIGSYSPQSRCLARRSCLRESHGKDGCRDRWPGVGLVCHHMRTGPGVEPGQDPDDDELEGQRPSACALGNSGVERSPGLGWV